MVPDDALAFSFSATTISQPVLSAQISNWSLAAALNVSPAASSVYKVHRMEMWDAGSILSWEEEER